MKDILLYHELFVSIAEEMGEVLRSSAFSPNIRDRLDFSCALFTGSGKLMAQAAHIPVHLGSMGYAVSSCAKQPILWREDEAVICNDPYRGGTHLPDVTLILPLLLPKESGRPEGHPLFFTATRAHHSDVGGREAASMGIARSLDEEGIVLPPSIAFRRGEPLSWFRSKFIAKARGSDEREGDLKAQWAACALGVQRLRELLGRYGLPLLQKKIAQLHRYTSACMQQVLLKLRDGKSSACDYLDDDGICPKPIRLAVTLSKTRNAISFDFSSTSDQVAGPVNTVPPVVASAIFYALRCLSPDPIPENHGLQARVRWRLRRGSLLHPDPGRPVALGNVETSQRLVDLIFRALSPLTEDIPSASQGTMNNLSLSSLRGKPSFSFYETIAGGCGAKKGREGTDAVHTHMTNTRNTPIEVMERTLPVRVLRYAIRQRSGGRGAFRGGNGIVRELEFLAPCQVSFVGERRKYPPYGLKGGEPGKKGAQVLFRQGKKITLPGKASFRAEMGDRLRISTPGGGGFGKKLEKNQGKE